MIKNGKSSSKRNVLLFACLTIFLASAIVFGFGVIRPNILLAENTPENEISFHTSGVKNSFSEGVDFEFDSEFEYTGDPQTISFNPLSQACQEAYNPTSDMVTVCTTQNGTYVKLLTVMMNEGGAYDDYFLTEENSSKTIYYKVTYDGTTSGSVVLRITAAQLNLSFSINPIKIINGTKLGDICVEGTISNGGSMINADQITWTWATPNATPSSSGQQTLNYSVAGNAIPSGSTEVNVDVFNDANCLNNVKVAILGYASEESYNITSISSLSKDFDGNSHGLSITHNESADYDYSASFKLANSISYGPAVDIQNQGNYIVYVKLEITITSSSDVYSYYKSFTYTINAMSASAVGIGTWDGSSFTSQTPTCDFSSGELLDGSRINVQVMIMANGMTILGTWEFENEGTTVGSSGTYYATFTPQNSSYPTLTHVGITVTVIEVSNIQTIQWSGQLTATPSSVSSGTLLSSITLEVVGGNPKESGCDVLTVQGGGKIYGLWKFVNDSQAITSSGNYPVEFIPDSTLSPGVNLNDYTKPAEYPTEIAISVTGGGGGTDLMSYVTIDNYTGAPAAGSHITVTVNTVTGYTIYYCQGTAGITSPEDAETQNAWTTTNPTFSSGGPYTVFVKVTKTGYTPFTGQGMVVFTAGPTIDWIGELTTMPVASGTSLSMVTINSPVPKEYDLDVLNIQGSVDKIYGHWQFTNPSQTVTSSGNYAVEFVPDSTRSPGVNLNDYAKPAGYPSTVHVDVMGGGASNMLDVTINNYTGPAGVDAHITVSVNGVDGVTIYYCAWSETNYSPDAVETNNAWSLTNPVFSEGETGTTYSVFVKATHSSYDDYTGVGMVTISNSASGSETLTWSGNVNVMDVVAYGTPLSSVTITMPGAVGGYIVLYSSPSNTEVPVKAEFTNPSEICTETGNYSIYFVVNPSYDINLADYTLEGFPSTVYINVAPNTGPGPGPMPGGFDIMPTNATYDGQSHGLSEFELPSGATIAFATLAANEQIPDDPSSVTYNLTAANISYTNAGSYTVLFAYTNEGNTSYGQTTINIQQVNLRAKVGSAMIQKGQPVPSFTVTYEGFVNGETSSVITNEEFSVAYSPSEPEAGIFDVMLMATAANYMINAEPAMLIVYEAGETQNISGEVSQIGGSGISGATVTLEYNHVVLKTVTTSSGGSYSLTDVPYGSYAVRATYNGASTFFSVDVSAGGVACYDEGLHLGGAYIDYQLAFSTTGVGIGISNVDYLATDVSSGSKVDVSAYETNEDNAIKEAKANGYVLETYVELSIMAGPEMAQEPLNSWSVPVLLLIELTENQTSGNLKVYFNNGSTVSEVPLSTTFTENLFYGTESGYLILGTTSAGIVGIAYEGEQEAITSVVEVSVDGTVESGTSWDNIAISVSGSYTTSGEYIGLATSGGSTIYGKFEFVNKTGTCDASGNYGVRFVVGGESVGVNLNNYDTSILPTQVSITVTTSGGGGGEDPTPDEFTVSLTGVSTEYDGQTHTLSNYLSADYTISFSSDEDIAADVGKEAANRTYSLEVAPSYKNVGNYTVYFKAISAVDSSKIYYGTTTIIVTKKAISVKANDADMTEDEDLPAFSASYNGFVAGENESVLGGTLAFDTNYTDGDGPGTYTITPKGLTSDNYTINYSLGTLTVNAVVLVQLTFSGKVYYDTTTSGNMVENATVVLKQNGTTKATTTTNNVGEFTFADVNQGAYIVFVSNGESSNFKNIELLTEDITNFKIAISQKNIKIEVAEGTINNVVIDNVTSLIDVSGSLDSEVFDSEKQDILEAGGSAEVSFGVITVEGTTEDATAIADFAKQINEFNKVTQFFAINIGLTMTTALNASTDYEVTKTTALLSFTLKLDNNIVGKENICVYRLHEGTEGTEIQTLTTTANRDGEKIELSADGRYITIYSNNFSLYAIGFYEDDSVVAEPLSQTTKIIIWAILGGCLLGMLLTTLIINAKVKKNGGYGGGRGGKSKKFDAKAFTNENKSAIPNTGVANGNNMPPYGQPPMGGLNMGGMPGAMTPNQMANRFVGPNPGMSSFGPQMPNGPAGPNMGPPNGGAPNNNGNNVGQ